MKHKLKLILPYTPWLLLLFAVNAFAALLLWIANAQALIMMSAAFLLATVFLFLAVCYVVIRLEQKKKQAFFAFLENPDDYHEKLLTGSLNPAHREPVRLLGQRLREKDADYHALLDQLNDYEEYVESWAHETKTPLSLLTLLLDNRGDEFPPTVHHKLDYIRNRVQEFVDQMLFYARLKGARADYLFEHLDLRACIDEILEDYRPLLTEKGFAVNCMPEDETVYSDRRGIRFLLGQLVSNAVKYSAENPLLCFELFYENNTQVLCVRDNGIGVRSCDFPYIFEKGFTGDSGEGRKKATGMGLYLAKGIAHELNLTLTAASAWGAGFEMRIAFPVVEATHRDNKCCIENL